MVHKRLEEIERLGNHTVLDFVNTIHHRYAPEVNDYLPSFEELVGWHELAGIITVKTGRELRDQARLHPRRAAAAHGSAIALRELLHGIFLAMVQGKKPSPRELSELNRTLNHLRPCCLLATGDHSLVWRWHIDPAQPESLLGPLVESAAGLLTSEKLQRIKECPAPHGCGWLFLDTSRNGSRNWCSMRNCGNLAKVRRHRGKAAASHAAVRDDNPL